MSRTTEFDPTVRVGEGITVLEASAGTGKTHAVASLVVAEVAAGRCLDELLVVTFTRKATGTLRERVWRRLAEAARSLEAGVPEREDELLAFLLTGDAADVEQRRVNLSRALSGFDAATIATTHGFCQQVLAGLGVAGDAERELEVVEDIRDLVTDAVDDLFVRHYYAGAPVLFDRPVAMRVAKAVVDHPDCCIGPDDRREADVLRRRFALTLRKRIEDQKRRGRLMTYDDLQARLDSSISDPARGPIVADRLRRRFSMAIVDEFQDTDSVQWRILRQAFGTPPSRLVLVGDPKQAIYAFRGGDVFAYLDATREAHHHFDLPVSWRADGDLLEAQDQLFAEAQLGAPEIRHSPLRARPGAPGCTLEGPAVGPALKVRIAQTASGRFGLTRYGNWAAKPSVRQFIAGDLAAEAVRILTAGTTIDGQPVTPGHLAVLTRTHRDADLARDALHAAGVPAVVHSGSSVLGTDAARDWLDLLRALEQPAKELAVRPVTLGPFIGWDAAHLAQATDAEWEDVDAVLREWAGALRTHSVAGLFRRIDAAGLAARLLGTVGGERALSDLRHVAELLHAWHAAHPTSIAGLTAWLAEQIADSDEDSERARRRLESDADAVAIHTIHGAKGLEFPIVLLPSLWDAVWIDDDAVPVFHDDERRRTIGVGARGPVWSRQSQRALEETDNEELRLLYVAVTRAKHQVVAWWAPAKDGDRSAMSRLLLGRDPDTAAVRLRLPKAPREAQISAELARRGIAFEDATGATGARYAPAPVTVGPLGLAVAAFDRTFDRAWVRTSYTGLTRAAHDEGLPASAEPAASTTAVEVDESAKVDEPAVAAARASSAADAAAGGLLPLGAVPGGARIGTLVHAVLERTDFTAGDLTGSLAAACTDVGARRLLEGHVDALVAGLALAIETPLGPDWNGTRLRDVRRADRLDELGFDLPLAGGDRPAGTLVTMDAIADVFTMLEPTDPLAGYHERLRDPRLAAAVRGFLTGGIDLVARIGERHVVVDYKTNMLAPAGETPSAWHYRPDALATAMQDAHYPLQAALYVVALHRFLRWRLAGYDPDRHLGGVAYLFLRGMTGPDVARFDGRPAGVFAWHPPTRFVLALSDRLDQGTP